MIDKELPIIRKTAMKYHTSGEIKIYIEKKYIEQDNRGDMRIIHVTRQFFEAGGPKGHCFEKTKKPVFRYGLGECVYLI